jgi:mRNA interferase HigB
VHFANIELTNVISNNGLEDLLKGKASDVCGEARAWYRVARAGDWKSLEDIRRSFPDADQVGNVLIFNTRGNRFRLIVTRTFPRNKLYVKAVLTHKEYDRKEWTKWV